MTETDNASYLSEVSRAVEEAEGPAPPLSHVEKERIRARERALFVDDVAREVLMQLATRRQDRERYREYLRSGISGMWRAFRWKIFKMFAPYQAIAHIESYMFAGSGSEKGKAYWSGKSGARMQEELRCLYRRTGKTG